MSADARDQLKSIVQRVERIEAEISDLNADKSEIYKEARASGFDVKAIKKVVSKRKIDEHEREEQDLVFETYWDAVHGTNIAHAHARENIEEFDPISGEFTESPRKAAEAVSERTAIQVEAKAEAEAGGSGQPETIPALTVQHDGVNVSGPERAGVTGGESAAINSDGGLNIVHKHTEIASASHGEAEAPSVERVTPETDGSAAANTGGGHVDDTQNAATHQAGGNVGKSPAAILRPDCLRPENCAGHGSTLCHACKKEAQGRVAA